jgi:hypothetical protein
MMMTTYDANGNILFVEEVEVHTINTPEELAALLNAAEKEA